MRCVCCGFDASIVRLFGIELEEDVYICEECDKHRTNLIYGVSVEESKKYFHEIKNNCVKEIAGIIDEWCGQRFVNHFKTVEKPMYYIENENEFMLVFKKKVMNISKSDGYSYIFYYQNGYLYSCWQSTFPYLYALNIDDCNQLGKGWHNEPESFYIHLKKCFGNSDGMLTLNGVDFFSFKYSQNSIMEEIYNYISRRISVMQSGGYLEENDPELNGNYEEESSVIEKQNEEEYNDEEHEENIIFSPADEIRKFKELYDLGIIDEEEFKDAKARLINKL